MFLCCVSLCEHGGMIGIPLTLMLSPRCASPRMSSQPEIVNDVPPPPEAVLSSSSRAATASHNQPGCIVNSTVCSVALLTADGFNKAGKHGELVLLVQDRWWGGKLMVSLGRNASSELPYIHVEHIYLRHCQYNASSSYNQKFYDGKPHLERFKACPTVTMFCVPNATFQTDNSVHNSHWRCIQSAFGWNQSA
jgi:hypothetical protein